MPTYNLRRSKRVPTVIEVTWHRRMGDVECIGADVNADGLFLLTDEPCEPGTLMQLLITLPEQKLSLLGVARFVGRTQAGNGIGVELFTLSTQGRRHWLAYYQQQLAVCFGEPVPATLAEESGEEAGGDDAALRP